MILPPIILGYDEVYKDVQDDNNLLYKKEKENTSFLENDVAEQVSDEYGKVPKTHKTHKQADHHNGKHNNGNNDKQHEHNNCGHLDGKEFTFVAKIVTRKPCTSSNH